MRKARLGAAYRGPQQEVGEKFGLEPANEQALRSIAAAYARLSETLLAVDNPPPSIVFDDRREQDASGSRIEIVTSPHFLLSGSVLDSTPVELSFIAGEQQVGQASLGVHELQGLWVTEFSLPLNIPAGVVEITVVAVDESGAKTSSSYRVRHKPPFIRTWWFAALLVTPPVATILIVLFLQRRRRRRLLKRRFNPYVAGAPILAQERFFGRQRLLEYVLRRISNNSILLYGERRIGKTSLQHRLKACLHEIDDPDHKFYPVFIDIQGTPEERFFATLASEIFDELATEREDLQPDPCINDGDYSHRHFVRDQRRVLKDLETRSHKKPKPVLLIDEVDELNDYDPRINQKLRSLFMRSFADQIVSVVSGVGIKKQWDREGSPWYNFFQEIEVTPFDPKEAQALVEAPLKGVFTFEEGVIDEILNRTESKPYAIQRLCSKLVDRLHDDRRRRITSLGQEGAVDALGPRFRLRIALSDDLTVWSHQDQTTTPAIPLTGYGNELASYPTEDDSLTEDVAWEWSARAVATTDLASNNAATTSATEPSHHIFKG